nr:protein FAR-RED IMPAIRED RESPONSE 1-like [Ziziphus jujuba var. spinosa]
MDTTTSTEDKIEPRIGMVFNSPDELVEFYKFYEKEKSFKISKRTSSKGDDGEVKYITLACSRNGKSKCTSRSALKLHPVIKTGCQAKFRAIKYPDGRWLIGSIVLEHNHELSTPSEARYYKSNRAIKPYIQRKLEINDKAGIRLNKNFNSLVVEAGGHEYLTFLEKDCRNYIDKIRRLRLGEGDAVAIQKYFLKMQADNSSFFYTMDLDYEG